MSTQDGGATVEGHDAEASPTPAGPLTAEAAEALAGLHDRPPAEHVAVYDALHGRLAAALAAAVSGEAGAAGPPVPRPGSAGARPAHGRDGGSVPAPPGRGA